MMPTRTPSRIKPRQAGLKTNKIPCNIIWYP
jgi:hypothetical protein